MATQTTYKQGDTFYNSTSGKAEGTVQYDANTGKKLDSGGTTTPSSSNSSSSTTPTHYTQTNNTIPTYGENSASVGAYQQSLNDKYKGVPGYTPLTVDNKYGPLTQAAANFKLPDAKSDQPLDRVTPPGAVAPVADKTKPDPFASEDELYKGLIKRSSDLIGATQQKYKDELKTADAASIARANAGGLGGSTAGGQIIAEGQRQILSAREADLQGIYSNIRELAHTYSNENYIKSQDAVKAMAANHLDWNEYKKTNPENYAALVKSLGGDPNYADALFASSIPPANIVQTWTKGTTQFQLTQDPITGKPSIQSYDLGVEIPQNWVSEKIGTNAVVYHGANWNPSDPSTYQIFGIDPLTGIPTGQIAGDANPGAPVSPNTITSAVTNVANSAGIDDPTIPLADAISQYGIGKIVSGIIANEGSSPSGVANNPGNIKFRGLPGQIDSGVKATDGGTFASYKTPEEGVKAIAGLIQSAVNGTSPAYGKDPTFASFINKYTGQTQGSQTSNTETDSSVSNGSILKATGLPIQVFDYLTKGQPSLTRMPIAQQTAVKAQANKFLNDNGIDYSTFKTTYDAYNDALATNVKAYNLTRRAETELTGTAALLSDAADDGDLKNVKVKNVLKLLAGEQVNDPDLIRYKTHLNQIVNEFAQYNAAVQGKNTPDLAELEDAKSVISAGISSKGLKGFMDAVVASTEKMDEVLQGNINATNKQVWELFGIGDKYQTVGSNSNEKKIDLTQYQAIPFTIPTGYNYNYERDYKQAADAVKNGADPKTVWGHFNSLYK